MSKPIFFKALPIVLLALLCLVLGGIIIAQNLNNDYIPTVAEPDESRTEAEETEAPPTEETVPAETEAPETEPPETEPLVVASEGLEFTSLGDGTSYVSGAGSCRDSFIILPEYSQNGEKVVGIGNYAFRNCTFLKSIELNENIRFVGAYAFYGSGLVNVNIPSETEQIGDFAFSNCSCLENINVDGLNSIYSDVDGVLFDKSEKILICYPQGKVESRLYLSSEVEEIKTMAFYNCDFLKMVDFGGSVSVFKRIKVGAGNESFENAVITYSSLTNVESNLDK